MNDDQLDDLKQYLDSRFSQSEELLNDRIDKLENRIDNVDGNIDSLNTKLGSIEQKVDDGFAGIGESLDATSEATDSQGKDHEKRITALEQQAA